MAAVAEARAAWQKTANRCLVQEDAKRAPKLACCPSASSSVKQVDAGSSNPAEAQDIPSVAFLPYSANSSYSNLSPGSRWWLQFPPNHCFNRDLVKEELNLEVSEVDSFQCGSITASESPNSEDGEAYFYESVDAENFVNSHFGIVKNDSGIAKQVLKPLDKQDRYDAIKVEDGSGYAVSEKTNALSYERESPWAGSERTEPWWRTSDRDELELLVSQRSFGVVENCDLPQPQHTRVKREPFAGFCHTDHPGILMSSIDQKHPGVDHDFRLQDQGTSDDHHFPSVAIEPLSDGTTPKAIPKGITGENDPGKAQLLEALRHSQTRAREAEKAATQAYGEKEHVVKLFFRQASQLFAYKQWFQLLQLENLYLQIKNQNELISSLFPVMLPSLPPKSRKPWKNWQKAARGKPAKRPRPKCDIGKYAFFFALGIGLVGAGLLLGWTVGWMLPTFE